jgi:hypothetical protein
MIKSWKQRSNSKRVLDLDIIILYFGQNSEYPIEQIKTTHTFNIIINKTLMFWKN